MSTHAEHTNDLIHGSTPPWEDDLVITDPTTAIKMGFAAITSGVGPGAGVFKNPTPLEPKIDLAGWSQRPLNPPDGATLLPETARRIEAQIASHQKAALLGKYKRFVPVSLAFAAMSRMPNTKVGCVILGEGFQVLSSGWNGAARGSRADVDGRLADRDRRLTWVCHAEANAIANAARSGTALNGGTLVVTLMPCMACAKSIVQAGIVRVLCPTPTDPRWEEDFGNARELFAECNVELVLYDTLGECE